MHVSQLSGHKNIDSLKTYHVASSKQKKRMSDIINGNNHTGYSLQVKKRPLDVTGVSNNISAISSHQQFLQTQDYNMDSLFRGASINNCNFHINLNSALCPQPKKRRVIYDSSDEE